ncbi:MAG: ATP-binding protein [Acidimicrobiia bacterium]
MAEPEKRDSRPIDFVLRRVVLIFRILAMVWMGGLVTATLLTDDEASTAWVLTASAVAVAVTVGTWFAAMTRDRLASWWWLMIDGAAAFFIGISPGLAGADDLFYGGMPLSWLLLVVYAHSSFLIGGIAVGALTLTQLVNAALDPDPLSATEYVGRIAVWVVSALAYGWAMWALRLSERQRIAAEQQRDAERLERRLVNERAEIAAQLHDSVLQTLALVQRDAADESTVRSLAHKQELELRNLIDRMASPYEHSFRAAVRRAAAEVEDLHRIRISSAFVGDCELEPNLTALVEAAREAMVNAAKHSGADELSLLCEAGPQQATIVVRDRGRGFDPKSARSDGGLARSITGRMDRHGGTVAIASKPREGTEVELTMPLDAEASDD